MEYTYMCDAVTLHECIHKKKYTSACAELKSHCSEALKVLHKEGYCYGDFRANNILVRCGKSMTSPPIGIIDFD